MKQIHQIMVIKIAWDQGLKNRDLVFLIRFWLLGKLSNLGG